MAAAAQHEVLRDEPGRRSCILGNLAVVRGALEAGVQFFSCYPGTPSSEIGDTFARIAKLAGVTFEYSVNEKIAVEIAFAACLTGARSMCGMKHLGLNYACDPISTMPYVGVGGGMVIVSAGDPSAITSPNEQDQRHFSRFLYYPVFDPATPDDAMRMTRYAFGFSEKTHLPVLLRPTTRVCHSGGMVEYGVLPEARNEIKFTKDPARHVPIPVNARRMRKELTERFERAEELLGRSEFFPRHGSGKYGIVASGVTYAYTFQVVGDLGLWDQVTLQQIGAYPIPRSVVADCLECVESVLVVEELTPFVEEWLHVSAHRVGRRIPIHGKLDGGLPMEFEYTPDLVEDAVREYVHLDRKERVIVSVPELPPRPPVLCPGCPHRASFYAAGKVFGKSTIYCNDIGCYTLGYGKPLASCDTLLCMGSSISQASGVARMTGRRAVAYIGDSTFFHSGLPALVNAVQADDNITVIVLDNFITAMTGFQPSLTTLGRASGSDCGMESPPPARFSIEDAARGLGVQEVLSIDPFDEDAAVAAFKRAKGGTGVNVVVCHAPCVVDRRRSGQGAKRPVFVIDPDRCEACSLCIRALGCPAISVLEERFTIDRELCDGCGLCARVCGHDAIRPASSVRT